MSINELFGLRGPVVAVSPVFAMALDDDPVAALLFAQLVYWTRGGTVEVSESADRIYAATGINRKRQARAREVLTAAGWVTERTERINGHTRLFYRVNVARAQGAIATWQESRPGAEPGPQNGAPKGIPGGSSVPQKGSRPGDERDPGPQNGGPVKPLPDAEAGKSRVPKGIPLRSREDPEKIQPAMRRGDQRLILREQADRDLAELRVIAPMSAHDAQQHRPEGPHGGSLLSWQEFADRCGRELRAAQRRRQARLDAEAAKT